MAQNLDNFDEALKIDYLPVIRKQLNNASYLLSKVQRNERDVVGKQWQMFAHYQRNSGVGSGTETGLPTAGNQAFKNPFGIVKYTRGRIQVSGPSIEASKNDKGAIARVLETETRGVTEDMRQEVNYQFFNDGTAVRGLINADPGTEVTLTLDTPGTNYLSDGIKIDILNPSGGAPRTGSSAITVSVVTSSTNAELSAAANAAVEDNDQVTRAGATDGAGTSYEMMGLKGLVDDGTYVTTLHNLSRTSFPWWKCSTYTSDDNSGTLRDMTLPLIQSGFTAVEKNGGKVNLILSDFDMRDAYAALVVADKRFVNTLNLDGGYKALEYNGIAWMADKDCLPNTVFFLDTERLQIMQMSDWNWMDKLLNCSSKILLNAGKPGEYERPNYGKFFYCRQSAGKIFSLAWRNNGWGGIVLYNPQEGKGKGLLLSRYFNSEHKPVNHRPMCGYPFEYMWIPHRNEGYLRVFFNNKEENKTMENTGSGFQEMLQVSSEDNTLPYWEKISGGIGTKLCFNAWGKPCVGTGGDEREAKSYKKSSETICRTVQNTEDIVRTAWRHAELPRNVEVLV